MTHEETIKKIGLASYNPSGIDFVPTNEYRDALTKILTEYRQQAVAEERKRVVGEIEIIKQKYNKIPTSVVNVKIMGVFCEVLASLDKPLTDKE